MVMRSRAYRDTLRDKVGTPYPALIYEGQQQNLLSVPDYEAMHSEAEKTRGLYSGTITTWISVEYDPVPQEVMDAVRDEFNKVGSAEGADIARVAESIRIATRLGVKAGPNDVMVLQDPEIATMGDDWPLNRKFPEEQRKPLTLQELVDLLELEYLLEGGTLDRMVATMNSEETVAGTESAETARDLVISFALHASVRQKRDFLCQVQPFMKDGKVVSWTLVAR